MISWCDSMLENYSVVQHCQPKMIQFFFQFLFMELFSPTFIGFWKFSSNSHHPKCILCILVEKDDEHDDDEINESTINQLISWLTFGRSFTNPSVKIAITVDVVVQNCIFKKVTLHLRWYSTGSRTANAVHDWMKQQPQQRMTNIGRVVVWTAEVYKRKWNPCAEDIYTIYNYYSHFSEKLVIR